MEKFKELLSKLQKLDIIQTHGDWCENMPFEEIYKPYLENDCKEIKHGLDVDTHRWYETSISVYETCGGLLGVRHITNMFSEGQGFEDCYVTLEFIEMKEVKVISYVCT